jgi:hypothetical protein
MEGRNNRKKKEARMNESKILKRAVLTEYRYGENNGPE